MIADLNTWINSSFILVFLITVLIFYYANNKPKKLVLIIILWACCQSLLAYFNFYQNTTAFPPRFMLVLIPSLIFIMYGLNKNNRSWIIVNRNIQWSTILHAIRLPIEMILFGLYQHQMIPKLMTFEGRNFDIIMGITAPIIGFLLYKNKLNTKTLIIWNTVGLFLVSFIMINGIFSTELNIQLFGFDQPNKAINYFPFILLPACIVPMVIWTHISDIIVLVKTLHKNNSTN